MFLHYKSWASENKDRGFCVYLIRPGFVRDTNTTLYETETWFDPKTIISYQIIENRKTYRIEIGLTNGSWIDLRIWGDGATALAGKALADLNKAVGNCFV